MNTHIAVRHRSHASWSFGHPGLWWAGIVVLALLGSSLRFSPATDHSDAIAEVQPLVHFQDASHDWLIVVDQATHELVVYDANDGRPLHRLGVDNGLSTVRSISRQGSSLFVTSDRHAPVLVLKLPESRPIALSAQ